MTSIKEAQQQEQHLKKWHEFNELNKLNTTNDMCTINFFRWYVYNKMLSDMKSIKMQNSQMWYDVFNDKYAYYCVYYHFIFYYALKKYVSIKWPYKW